MDAAERWRKEKLEWVEWPVPFWASSRVQAAEALVSLFNGEDDMLVELLEVSRSGSLSVVTGSSGSGSDGHFTTTRTRFVPGPHHVFVAALRSLVRWRTLYSVDPWLESRLLWSSQNQIV